MNYGHYHVMKDRDVCKCEKTNRINGYYENQAETEKVAKEFASKNRVRKNERREK